MKKCLFLMICLLIGIKGVYASTLNDSKIGIDNNIITQGKYEELIEKYGKRTVDNIYNYNSKIIKVLGSNTVRKKSTSKYVITTYILNNDGYIIGENSIETTKENAKRVANNDNLIVDDMGNIVDSRLIQNRYDAFYTTTSKGVGMDYYYDNSGYVIYLNVDWYKLPNIRDFDVAAVRWTNSVSTSGLDFYAEQHGSGSDFATYSKSSTPNYYVQSPYGLGITMNLFNNSTSLLIQAWISSETALGSHVYGTYQHAKNTATTLAISKSYSFSSTGLGGVLLYSNSTYSSYYDGMGGVSI